MRTILLSALVLLLLIAPDVLAQTTANPVQGPFTERYVVAGRIIDHDGNPYAGGTITVSLSGAGLQGKPTLAKTNCFGDYITFFDIADVHPGDSVVVVAQHEDGTEGARATTHLDPFFRRTDLNLRLDNAWLRFCEDSALWPGRVTVTGRIVNRTEPYRLNNISYDARPFAGEIKLLWRPRAESAICPPGAAGPGTCEAIQVDERGDFRYSYTFGNQSVNATGFMEIVRGNVTFNVTVDPLYRIAVLHGDLSGRGPPTPPRTPGIAPAALAALAGVVALARRRRT